MLHWNGIEKASFSKRIHCLALNRGEITMWLGPSQLHLDELFSPGIAGTLPREGGTINIVELIRSADSLQKLQMQ